MKYGEKRNRCWKKVCQLWEKVRERWICVSVFSCIVVLAIVFFMYLSQGIDFFRLDQYAETICTTTAGIVGTMFGLTAASYAFRCGDLRNESQEKPHLQKILEKYMDSLWYAFIYSLVFTIITILSSLMILFFMQQFTSPISYRTYWNSNNKVVEYFTVPAGWICYCVAFNFVIACISVIIMAIMNRSIFKREEKHVKIARGILNKISDMYDVSLEVPKRDVLYEEYEKIHNLEVIIKRILKNHESMGEAFTEEQRRKNLLTVLINQTLNSEFKVATESIPGEMNAQYWNYLREQKRQERWNECFVIAKRDYENIYEDRLSKEEKKSKKLKPVDCNFIRVYDDLLTYRDCKLVITKTNNCVELDGRALRYTIKKRLLMFYLRGEEFSNMDLSRISFSGADLRYTNFSGSNLTGVRLKGANCQGTDFSRVKMPGMYFCDAEKAQDVIGEIQLTCLDDMKESWNVYTGKEITNFEEATFTDADVSRAYLDASKAERFLLTGTNFDRAKMFLSLFNNVNLTNASLEQAQMYNSAFVNMIAKASNFSKSIMTNCCIAQCDFSNANFGETSLVETILYDSRFDGAKLTTANFAYSNIVSCNFDGASCQNVSFKNVVQDVSQINNRNIRALRDVNINDMGCTSFKFATLTRTDFSGADLSEMNFENVIGSECVFTMAKGRKIVFDKAMMIGSVFNTICFENCSFENTILRNSIIISSQFYNCMFLGTDFSSVLFDMKDEFCFIGGAILDADFSDCQGILARNFKNCILRNVNFSGTGLRKVDFLTDVKVENCIF